MSSELTALASAAATALAGLMVTDGWERTKAAVVELWRRVHPDRAGAVDADLTQARRQLIQAREGRDDRAEAELATEWAGGFEQLLTGAPRLELELRRLIEEFQLGLQPARQAQPEIVMRAKATGQGRVYQAGRDQRIAEGP